MPRNENDLLRWGDIVNALYNYHKSTPANRAFGMAEIRAVLHELEFVEKVDPESLRPHGEWKNIEVAIVDTTGNCGRCGKEAVWRTRNKSYALCPNCGADMRKENLND